MVPLLLAVSVITFAVSASAVSDDWRVSRAKADVGAARTFQTEASVGRLLDGDPGGRPRGPLPRRGGGGQRRRRHGPPGAGRHHPARHRGGLGRRPGPTCRRAPCSASCGRRRTGSPSPATRSRSPRARCPWSRRPATPPCCGCSTSTRTASSATPSSASSATAPRRARSPARSAGATDGCTLEQLFVSGPSLSVLDVDGSVTLAWRGGRRAAGGLAARRAGRVAGGPAVPGVAGGPAGHPGARRATGCVWTSTSASCRPASTRSPPWWPASPGSRRRRTPDVVPVVATDGTAGGTGAPGRLRGGDRLRRLGGARGRAQRRRPAGARGGTGARPSRPRRRGVARRPRDLAGGVRAAVRRLGAAAAVGRATGRRRRCWTRSRPPGCR